MGAHGVDLIDLFTAADSALYRAKAVDDYFTSDLVDEDDALAATRTDSRTAGLPGHKVAANQGGAAAALAPRQVGWADVAGSSSSPATAGPAPALFESATGLVLATPVCAKARPARTDGTGLGVSSRWSFPRQLPG